MNSLTFQPVLQISDCSNSAFQKRLRKTKAPVVMLNAPKGYGKTTQAVEYFSQWQGKKLWVNSPWLLNSCDSYASIIGALETVLSVDAAEPVKSSKQFSERMLALLSASNEPVLIIIDEIDLEIQSSVLLAMLDVSQCLSNFHKVLLTGYNPGAFMVDIVQKRPVVEHFNVSDLKLSNAEVDNLLSNEKITDSGLKKLVHDCHGWPEAVCMAAAQFQSNHSFQSIYQNLLLLHSGRISQGLSAESLDIAQKLRWSQKFDSSLIELLEVKKETITELQEFGLISRQFSIHHDSYIWSVLALDSLKMLSSETLIPKYIAATYLDWTTQNNHHLDALTYATQVETAEDIQRRVIIDGYWIQEKGGARLLAVAIDKIERDNPILVTAELLMVSAAASWDQNSDDQKNKINAYHRLLRGHCDYEICYRSQLNTVLAQNYLAQTNVSKAERLVEGIELSLPQMNPYFQIQALGVLGEIENFHGRCEQALIYFCRGEDLARVQKFPSSLLWHLHQKAQTMLQLGHVNRALNVRFMAIQFAREQDLTHLFQYSFILKAQCEQLLAQLRLTEAMSLVEELELIQVQSYGLTKLSVAVLKLECHRLFCLADSNYRGNIVAVVVQIETELLGECHHYEGVRAKRALLNYWVQTESYNCIAQWYNNEAFCESSIENAEQLMALRNTLFAYNILMDQGVNIGVCPPVLHEANLNQWQTNWPSLSCSVICLYKVYTSKAGILLSDKWMLKGISGFALYNDLAEALSYQPSWYDDICANLSALPRLHRVFLSRITAIRGEKRKSSMVRGKPAVSVNDARFGLSPRQHQLLQLISKGASNESIADQLNLSLGTIKNQLTDLYRKLGVSGRRAAGSRYQSLADVN